MKQIKELSIFRKKALGLPMTEEEVVEHRKYMAEWNRKNYQTPKTRARNLYNSALKASRQKNLPFNLTKDWIEQKLLEGLCEVSGIKFQFESMKTGKYGAGSQNPFGPSLDRTIPELGYTVDNVKVVVWIYNMCKQNNTHDEVMILAKALVNQN